MTHHTKDKGNIALAYAILDLTRKGYDVYTAAVSEHSRFDLAAYKEGKFYRLQIKYRANGEAAGRTSWADKNGSHMKKYDPTDFDYYGIYLPDIDKMVYPSSKFMGAVIRTDIPNSPTPFYWYEDFLAFTDKAEKKTYKDFGVEITKAKKPYQPVYSTRKVERPSKEVLESLMKEKNMTTIAAIYGVSSKAIEKWAKAYNIPRPGRGRWIK